MRTVSLRDTVNNFEMKDSQAHRSAMLSGSWKRSSMITRNRTRTNNAGRKYVVSRRHDPTEKEIVQRLRIYKRIYQNRGNLNEKDND